MCTSSLLRNRTIKRVSLLIFQLIIVKNPARLQQFVNSFLHSLNYPATKGQRLHNPVHKNIGLVNCRFKLTHLCS